MKATGADGLGIGRTRPRVIAASGEAVGEGAGRPGLARCVVLYRFDEADCPAWFVFHEPSGWRPSCGPYRIIRPDHCWTGRGANVTPRGRIGALPKPAARQADAIHRHPQGPPRYPSPGLHRSTTARRHRGTWIRRPPHRRDGGYYEGEASGVAKVGVLNPQAIALAECFFANATIISGERHRLLPVGKPMGEVARRVFPPWNGSVAPVLAWTDASPRRPSCKKP
jgi:hypothetical protein